MPTRTASGFVHSSCAAACAVLLLVGAAAADSSITDFNAASLGSYSPRDGWHAFGAGTSDRGVHAAGTSGHGAFHAVNWNESTWGVGDIFEGPVDLSAFDAVAIDARLVDLGGHSGTALFQFALDLPDGVEYSTPTQGLGTAYQTYSFALADLELSAGSGPLDLTAGTPKIIVRRNGQSGPARFDFDEITAIGGGGGPTELTPVTLRWPPDGDDVRAMWLYASAGNLRVVNLADAQAILDFCAAEGINRIYFHAYYIWALGSTADKAALRTFLEVARASGIRVEALLDGVDWHNHPTTVQTHLGYVLAIHNATPGDADDDFSGVHFDIEFWLDDSWDGNLAQREQVARDYFDNVLITARSYLDAHGGMTLPIAVDLSSHFDTSGMLPAQFEHGGLTQFFLEHVFDHADDVVLMSYYDSAGALSSVANYELSLAHGKGRRLQLGADQEPNELPINTFADNLPTAYAAMTMALQNFHAGLSSERAAALAGFSVFHYDGYRAATPAALSVADLDGDEDVDADDFTLFVDYLGGPSVPAIGVARDADFDLSGATDIADFARLAVCFTGPDCGCPVPANCER